MRDHMLGWPAAMLAILDLEPEPKVSYGRTPPKAPVAPHDPAVDRDPGKVLTSGFVSVSLTGRALPMPAFKPFPTLPKVGKPDLSLDLSHLSLDLSDLELRVLASHPRKLGGEDLFNLIKPKFDTKSEDKYPSKWAETMLGKPYEAPVHTMVDGFYVPEGWSLGNPDLPGIYFANLATQSPNANCGKYVRNWDGKHWSRATQLEDWMQGRMSTTRVASSHMVWSVIDLD